MIQIIVERDRDGTLQAFTVSGHAGWSEKGRDIVCAAVSALAQAAVLGLSRHLQLPVAVTRSEGRLTCKIPPIGDTVTAKAAAAIVETMLIGLADIAGQYRDFIRITEYRR